MINVYKKRFIEGKNILDSIKNTEDAEKFCVFFDIDDTLINSNNGTKIKPIIDLYNYAIKKKISTIIITARPGFKENIKNTINELSMNNIKNYDLLYLRPENMTDVKEFKLFARRNATECGYTPLFSIGDMFWDVGDYGGIPLVLQ
jgi:hypothetical protein